LAPVRLALPGSRMKLKFAVNVPLMSGFASVAELFAITVLCNVAGLPAAETPPPLSAVLLFAIVLDSIVVKKAPPTPDKTPPAVPPAELPTTVALDRLMEMLPSTARPPPTPAALFPLKVELRIVAVAALVEYSLNPPPVNFAAVLPL